MPDGGDEKALYGIVVADAEVAGTPWGETGAAGARATTLSKAVTTV